MKLSSFLPLLICSAFSKATYVPFGTPLGDFTTAQSFPPKVLLNYLTTCAGSIITDPDGCLVSSFADLRIPFDYVDATMNQIAPSVTGSEITVSASVAQTSCSDATVAEANTLAVQYQTAIDFDGGACWTSLFDPEAHVPILIESKWIKNCADTTLPYPITAEEYSTLSPDTIQHRSILTCMLDLAFEIPADAYGLNNPIEGSPESCFPTGYAEIGTFCPSTLGPQILQACLAAKEEYTDDVLMSMDYSDPNAGNTSDSVVLIEDFCEMMTLLSSDAGRGCLLDVCEFNPTQSPSATPSKSPFLAPSTAPSATLSLFPSSSSAPSSLPSSSPSFSSSPTLMPSSKPSSSSVPSTTPSSVSRSSSNPSAKPSLNPSSSSLPSSTPSSTPSSSVNPSTIPSDLPSTSQAPSITVTDAPYPVPSMMASSAPSEVVSSMPSVSTKPSITMSAAPSVPQSSVPSSAPFVSPPSSRQSMSQLPSFGEVQARVDIQVFSTVILNISSEDVPSDPTDFLDVIGSAISILVAPSDVTVSLQVADDSIRRIRRLVVVNMLELLVHVKASRSCFLDDCDDYGVVAAGKIEQQVQMATTTGALSDNIQDIAVMKNVTILETAVVLKFLVVNNTVSVEDIEEDEEEVDDGSDGDDTDGTITSSAPFTTAHWCGFATALAGITLI